jgi:hypothetical protein
MKQFDLNIEKILENWETYHAVREIIANALDEQLITNTPDIEIFKVGSNWVIRDYGRGIRYTNLTQNENQEKLTNPNVIGKFGIGLKDALATFDRNKISVLIKSRYGDITLSKTSKQGFSDIVTLHANIDDPSEPNLVGTMFIIEGINDESIEAAKRLFLIFSGEQIIETTKFGQVIKKSAGFGNIYINGVKVAEEPNFLFSYNITEKTKAIQKALNRERSNVGRTAYTDSIKKILLASSTSSVAKELANDLQNYNEGLQHDELSWIDVQEHSVKILNQTEKVIFVTSSDLILHRDMIDQAKSSGHTIITIPENLKQKISGGVDFSGNSIVDISQFVSLYNESFEFKFVSESQLSSMELSVFKQTNSIIEIIGGLPDRVKAIKISETMVKELFSSNETLGCWDPSTNCIVISRKQLHNLKDYSGTLIHEIIHAKTGFVDVSREFETALTNAIGTACVAALNKEPTKKSWFGF